MHAITISNRCLTPLLNHMQVRRLATLLEAVASCVNGPALSLTDVGRRFVGPTLLRHKIKRAVQHRFLQRLGEVLPGGVAPIIVADSGFKVPFYREVERLG